MLFIITALISAVLVRILTPPARTIAFHLRLTDQPGTRKVHHTPVPVIGGIVVFVATCLSIMLQMDKIVLSPTISVLLAGAAILLVTGIIDDKFEVKAVHKLIIEMALGTFVYASGNAITSLYGFMGMYEIEPNTQFVLTILVVAGAINAFNLMDGIDGLAASLAIVGLMVFSWIAWNIDRYDLLCFYGALSGALLGFLWFNFSKKQKIFLGDAGSLFIGYVLVVSGLHFLKAAEQYNGTNFILPAVIGIWALPIIDALRVFGLRIISGGSPFRPDKTHLHHLFLGIGLQHKTATMAIVSISVLLFIISGILSLYYPVTIGIMSIVVVFGLLAGVLKQSNDVRIWREKLKKMEQY